MKVPVTKRAFVTRCKRHLSNQGRLLKMPHPKSDAYKAYGQFIIVNNNSQIEKTFTDIEQLKLYAAENNILKQYENVLM